MGSSLIPRQTLVPTRLEEVARATPVVVLEVVGRLQEGPEVGVTTGPEEAKAIRGVRQRAPRLTLVRVLHSVGGLA